MHTTSLSRRLTLLAALAALATPAAHAGHSLGLFPGRGILSDTVITNIRGELLEVAAAFQDDATMAARFTRLRRRLHAIQDQVVEIREEQLSLARTWAADHAREVTETRETPMLAGHPEDALRRAYRERGDELLALEYKGNNLTHRIYEVRFLRRPRREEMEEYVAASKASEAPEFSGVLEKIARLREREAAYDAEARAFCAEATPLVRDHGLCRDIPSWILDESEAPPRRIRPMGLYLHYFQRHVSPEHFESVVRWVPSKWRLRLMRGYFRAHAGKLGDAWLTRVVRRVPARARAELLGLAAG